MTPGSSRNHTLSSIEDIYTYSTENLLPKNSRWMSIRTKHPIPVHKDMPVIILEQFMMDVMVRRRSNTYFFQIAIPPMLKLRMDQG